MSDITERLRGKYFIAPTEIMREAADEIERLRHCCILRGVRMEVLRDAIIEAYLYEPSGPLQDIIARAASWFDADGFPLGEEPQK
jgi:hypothetical protein